jgi:hypothetical protein
MMQSGGKAKASVSRSTGRGLLCPRSLMLARMSRHVDRRLCSSWMRSWMPGLVRSTLG